MLVHFHRLPGVIDHSAVSFESGFSLDVNGVCPTHLQTEGIGWWVAKAYLLSCTVLYLRYSLGSSPCACCASSFMVQRACLACFPPHLLTIRVLLRENVSMVCNVVLLYFDMGLPVRIVYRQVLELGSQARRAIQ